MDKAYSFEKHRRRLKRKAYLNFLLILLISGGFGTAMLGPLEAFLGSELLRHHFLAVGIMTGGAWLVIWLIPLLHYRETVRISYDGEIEDVKGISEDFPSVEILQEQGWEIVDSGEDFVELEISPTWIHELLGRKSRTRIEVDQSRESSETLVVSINGRGREKIEAEYSEKDGQVLIEQEAASMHRLSLSYLEPVMLMIPEIRDMVEETDSDMTIEDVNMELSWKKYQL